jgi:hypothetical protein
MRNCARGVNPLRVRFIKARNHFTSHRSNNMSTSTSHPMLNFNNNNNLNSSGSARNLFSSTSRGQTHDKSTQTPENIERETRRHKLRSLKINFNNVPTPSLNFKLSFLNQRKRTNLSANAVATEQKATKVTHSCLQGPTTPTNERNSIWRFRHVLFSFRFWDSFFSHSSSAGVLSSSLTYYSLRALNAKFLTTSRM